MGEQLAVLLGDLAPGGFRGEGAAVAPWTLSPYVDIQEARPCRTVTDPGGDRAVALGADVQQEVAVAGDDR